MDEKEILELFTEVIQRRDAIKVTGLSKYQVYNYRNRDSKPVLGTQLEILFRAGKIKIESNESEAGKE